MIILIMSSIVMLIMLVMWVEVAYKRNESDDGVSNRKTKEDVFLPGRRSVHPSPPIRDSLHSCLHHCCRGPHHLCLHSCKQILALSTPWPRPLLASSFFLSSSTSSVSPLRQTQSLPPGGRTPCHLCRPTSTALPRSGAPDHSASLAWVPVQISIYSQYR
jgi:hypothetical protein